LYYIEHISSRDKLILCYFKDVNHVLEIRSLSNGSLLQEIPLEIGIISEYSIRKEISEFFFKFENMVTAGKIYRCLSSETTVQTVCSVSAYFNTIAFPRR
jgi:prolyl oligopeptidase